MYFVYIIESEVDGDFYKGVSEDYVQRINNHNEGKSKFTSTKIPWKLVFLQVFELKEEALKEEKRLKRCNKRYLRWLIDQDVNILSKK